MRKVNQKGTAKSNIPNYIAAGMVLLLIFVVVFETLGKKYRFETHVQDVIIPLVLGIFQIAVLVFFLAAILQVLYYLIMLPRLMQSEGFTYKKRALSLKISPLPHVKIQTQYESERGTVTVDSCVWLLGSRRQSISLALNASYTQQGIVSGITFKSHTPLPKFALLTKPNKDFVFQYTEGLQKILSQKTSITAYTEFSEHYLIAHENTVHLSPATIEQIYTQGSVYQFIVSDGETIEFRAAPFFRRIGRIQKIMKLFKEIQHKKQPTPHQYI